MLKKSELDWLPLTMTTNSHKAKYSNPFTATLSGIVNMFKKHPPVGVLSDDDRIDGKVCLVTGANSGLGFAVTQQLVERGGKVIMACRSGIPEAGEEIKRLTGSENVEMLKVDLSDIESITKLITELKARNVKLDIAIFNAAIVPKGSRKTDEGLDQMFMVNYLAKFILIKELLAADLFNKQQTPRIIYVSSESHRSGDDIDFDKFGQFEEYTMSKVIALYGYYKLHLNTLAAELSRRLNKEGISYSVHSLCPGAVNTNIARESPKIFMPLLKLIFGIFFQAPAKAAIPVIYLACSKEIEGKSDYYLHMMAKKEPDHRSLNVDTGKILWEKSENLLKAIAS